MVGAMAEGLVLEPYRSTTLPCLSTKNLVKFHSEVRAKNRKQKANMSVGYVGRSSDQLLKEWWTH